MKISRKVYAFAVGSDYCMFNTHAEDAAYLLSSGRAIERAKSDKRGITEISILPNACKVTARAGSFGIHRARVAPKNSGMNGHAGLVFSHKSTHERALAAA